MAIDLDREYFFSDVKLASYVQFYSKSARNEVKSLLILSICFLFFIFYFLNEKDTLGARSKIGYNDIGYFAIYFPTI